MRKNNITIPINRETLGRLAQLDLSETDRVKIRVFEVEEEISELEAQLDKLKDELKELKKEAR